MSSDIMWRLVVGGGGRERLRRRGRGSLKVIGNLGEEKMQRGVSRGPYNVKWRVEIVILVPRSSTFTFFPTLASMATDEDEQSTSYYRSEKPTRGTRG